MEDTICDICDLTLTGTRIGHGDGTGNRFAHPDCYWRERSEKAESLLNQAKAILAGWVETRTSFRPPELELWETTRNFLTKVNP